MAIDFALLAFVTVVLFPYTLIVPTVVGGIDLCVFWFVPLSVAIDADAMLLGNNTLGRFACCGVASGLMTPPLSVLDKWIPALFSQVGVYDARASKLSLEVFSDDIVRCLHEMIPTAVFASIVWVFIYMFNRLLVKSYHSSVIPATESLLKWLKEVYRF